MPMTQAEIDKVAAQLKEDGLPDEFNRWIGMTPEAELAQRRRVDDQVRRAAEITMKIGPREAALRAMRESASPATTTNPPAPPAKKETTVMTIKTNAKRPAPKKAEKPAAKKKVTKTAARVAAARKADKAKKKAPKTIGGGSAKLTAAIVDAAAKPLKVNIGSIAHEAILAGKSNEEALAAVKAKFPDGNTNAGNIAWYRNDLRKKGLLPKAEKEIGRAHV